MEKTTKNKINVEWYEYDTKFELCYFDERIQLNIEVEKTTLQDWYYKNGFNEVEITGHYMDDWSDYVVDRDYTDFVETCEMWEFTEFLMEYFNYEVKDQWIEKLKSEVLKRDSDFFLVNDDDEAMEQLFNNQPNWNKGFYYVEDWGYLINEEMTEGFKKFIDITKAVYASELVNN